MDSDDQDKVEYEGVRKVSKLSLFLTTDLLSYYATRIFDTHYGAKDANSDKKKRAERIHQVVRDVMIFVEGRNDGTAINQMSQRISNMIYAAYLDEKQPYSSKTVVVKKELLDTLKNTYEWRTSLTQSGQTINAKVSKISSKDLTESIIKDIFIENGILEDCSENVNPCIPVFILTRWISRAYIVQSRSQVKYASISKKLDDMLYSIRKSSLSDCPIGFIEDVIRMGIALKCIMYGAQMKCVGDVCEPVFKLEGLSNLLPSMMYNIQTEPLRSLAFMGPPGCGKTYFSENFDYEDFEKFDCEGTIDVLDTGLQLHKLQITWGYSKPFCLVVLWNSKYGTAIKWMSSLSDSLKSMMVKPGVIIVISNDDPATRMSPDVERSIGGQIINLTTSIKNDNLVLDDKVKNSVRSICDLWIDIDDIYIESLLFSVVKDILSIGHIGILEVHDKHRKLRSEGKYPGNISFIKDMLACSDTTIRINNRDDLLDAVLSFAMMSEIKMIVSSMPYLLLSTDKS